MDDNSSTSESNSSTEGDSWELSLRKTQHNHDDEEEYGECWCVAELRQDPGFPPRRSLPKGLTPQGRPVWEPPVKDMTSDIIGEHYEKLREAVLKFTGGARAKTTQLLDWHMESVVAERYEKWAEQMSYEMESCGDNEGSAFFWGLFRELYYDGTSYFEEGYQLAGCVIVVSDGRNDKYRVECHDPYAPLWDGDPRIIKKVEEYNEWREAEQAKSDAENGAAKPEQHDLHQARGRLVAQGDDGEEEEMEWLGSIETQATQRFGGKPLILQILDSRNLEQSMGVAGLLGADIDVD